MRTEGGRSARGSRCRLWAQLDPQGNTFWQAGRAPVCQAVSTQGMAEYAGQRDAGQNDAHSQPTCARMLAAVQRVPRGPEGAVLLFCLAFAGRARGLCCLTGSLANSYVMHLRTSRAVLLAPRQPGWWLWHSPQASLTRAAASRRFNRPDPFPADSGPRHLTPTSCPTQADLLAQCTNAQRPAFHLGCLGVAPLIARWGPVLNWRQPSKGSLRLARPPPGSAT